MNIRIVSDLFPRPKLRGKLFEAVDGLDDRLCQIKNMIWSKHDKSVYNKKESKQLCVEIEKDIRIVWDLQKKRRKSWDYRAKAKVKKVFGEEAEVHHLYAFNGSLGDVDHSVWVGEKRKGSIMFQTCPSLRHTIKSAREVSNYLRDRRRKKPE